MRATRFFTTALLISGLFIADAGQSAFANSPTQTAVRAQMDSEEFKTAIKTITKAQEAGEASDFDLNQMLVESYMGRIDQVGMTKKMGLAKKMRKAMERSLEMRPNDPDALQNLIRFHLEAPGIVGGNKDTAAQLVERAVAADPVAGNLAKAQMAFANKDDAAGMAALDAAEQAAPNDPEVHLSRGVVLSNRGKAEAGIAALEKCRALDPDNQNCLYQIGKAAQTGNVQLEKGQAAFEAFLKNPEAEEAFLPWAHLRLGHIHKLRGETDKARSAYQKAVDLTDLKQAKEALKTLDE